MRRGCPSEILRQENRNSRSVHTWPPSVGLGTSTRRSTLLAALFRHEPFPIQVHLHHHVDCRSLCVWKTRRLLLRIQQRALSWIFLLSRGFWNRTSSSNCPLNLICTSGAAKHRSWELRCPLKEMQLSACRPSYLRQEYLVESVGSPPSYPRTGSSLGPEDKAHLSAVGRLPIQSALRRRNWAS